MTKRWLLRLYSLVCFFIISYDSHGKTTPLTSITINDINQDSILEIIMVSEEYPYAALGYKRLTVERKVNDKKEIVFDSGYLRLKARFSDNCIVDDVSKEFPGKEIIIFSFCNEDDRVIHCDVEWYGWDKPSQKYSLYSFKTIPKKTLYQEIGSGEKEYAYYKIKAIREFLRLAREENWDACQKMIPLQCGETETDGDYERLRETLFPKIRMASAEFKKNYYLPHYGCEEEVFTWHLANPLVYITPRTVEQDEKTNKGNLKDCLEIGFTKNGLTMFSIY